MGTTRIKVIDLSSDQKEIKTSRKHAAKLTVPGKVKTDKKQEEEKPVTTESTEKPVATVNTEERTKDTESVPNSPQTVRSVVARKRHQGKKYLQARQLIDVNKTYSAADAIELLNKTSWTKFDPTVEIHLNVADKNIKGSVNLPHPIGKKKEKRYLIFSDKKTVTESTEKKTKGTEFSVPSDPSAPSVITNHIIWGDEKTIDEIQNGKLRPNRDFDAVIAEPKFMTHLVKVAKILGPRGMMPNPKNKTVTENPQSAIEKQDKSPGACEYKTDPTAPIIHLVLGKLSLKPDQLEKNLQALVSAIGPTKIKKAVIKSTMSPAIKVDVSTSPLDP